MYTTTVAVLARQLSRSASPRPLRGSLRTRTRSNCSASSCATLAVPSVLALSTMTTVQS
jgi:hypothetical protein